MTERLHTSPLQRLHPFKRLLDVWEWGSIYLPLVIMAATALGTYWLVRNSPQSSAPVASQAAGHEVDYFMRKFTVKSFNDKGQLKSEVTGLEARHYADTDTLEIDQARIQSLSDQGRLVVSTANRALSNSDVSEVQLSGNARVVREETLGANGQTVPRLEFQGEFLHAFVNEERVTSNKPVVLIRGSDRFTAETFAYDSLSGVADLKGRVRAQLTLGSTAAPAASPATP
jgi:lipopolysaccharide export system protein LptC